MSIPVSGRRAGGFPDPSYDRAVMGRRMPGEWLLAARAERASPSSRTARCITSSYERLVDSGIGEGNLYLWAQEELQLSPQLRVQLGVRSDYFTYDVDDRLDGQPSDLPHASGYAHQMIVSPKASLVFSPAAEADLFLNVGSGFHSNDARDIVIDRRIADLVRTWRREGASDAEIDDRLTDRNFDPQHVDVETLPRAVGGEVGIRVRPINGLNLAAAAWFIDLEREFVFVGDGGFTELSGRSRRYGLDVETRLGLTSWLSRVCRANRRPCRSCTSHRACRVTCASG